MPRILQDMPKAWGSSRLSPRSWLAFSVVRVFSTTLARPILHIESLNTVCKQKRFSDGDDDDNCLADGQSLVVEFHSLWMTIPMSATVDITSVLTALGNFTPKWLMMMLTQKSWTHLHKNWTVVTSRVSKSAQQLY